MSAKDYTLAVTGLTNSIWICKTSKRNTGTMTDDRVKIDESHFIGCIMEWLNGKIDEKEDTLSITSGGKVVADFKINRKALGLTK